MKKSIFIIIATALFLVSAPSEVFASKPNPELAAQIVLLTEQSKSVLKSQRIMQLSISEGHVFVGREVKLTTDWYKKYNEYLDSCKNVLATAAELYATYTEIQSTVKNLSDISHILANQPENSVALALHPDRSRVYTDIVNTSVNIAQDIYNVCVSKAKRTENEVYEIMDDIRLKLHRMNKQLSTLALYLRYTSFEDVMEYVLGDLKYAKMNKQDICDKCLRKWSRSMITRI